MFEKKAKPFQMANKDLMESRMTINGDVVIKEPYYYLRNGLLHARYTVDRCIELTSAEETKLKLELTASSYDKQSVLSKAWNLFTCFVGKTIITDGIKAGDDRIKAMSREFNKHGCKN